MINELHGDDRIGFDYDGHFVTFGDNLYAWDFEQIKQLIYEVTGYDFPTRSEAERIIVDSPDNFTS